MKKLNFNLKKAEFKKFLNSAINEEKPICVVCDRDMDGIPAAIFLLEILNSQKINLGFLDIRRYDNNMVKEIIFKMEKGEFTHVVVLDLAIDQISLEDYNELRRRFKLFHIDHHPINPKISNTKNILKTPSRECTSFNVYRLALDYVDMSEWEWLLVSSMICDFCFEACNEYFKGKFNFKKETLFDTKQGKYAKKLSYVIIFYKDSPKKAFEIIRERNKEEINRCFEAVEKEILNAKKMFKKNAEIFKKAGVAFFEISPKLDIISSLSTILSIKNPSLVLVLISREGNIIKASARTQDRKIKLNEMLKFATAGLENSNSGGHDKASGASFNAEDVWLFKKRVVEFCSKED